MISVDTIDKELGNVINCNSYVKTMLGFAKEDIQGKNITKLMPKIFTELHNNLMLNFLRKNIK